MIVKIEVLYDDIEADGARSRDKIIRAIDRAMNGASWESADKPQKEATREWEATGGSWIARR